MHQSKLKIFFYFGINDNFVKSFYSKRLDILKIIFFLNKDNVESPTRADSKNNSKRVCSICYKNLNLENLDQETLNKKKNGLSRYSECCHICNFTYCPKHSYIVCIPCNATTNIL